MLQMEGRKNDAMRGREVGAEKFKRGQIRSSAGCKQTNPPVWSFYTFQVFAAGRVTHAAALRDLRCWLSGCWCWECLLQREQLWQCWSDGFLMKWITCQSVLAAEELKCLLYYMSGWIWLVRLICNNLVTFLSLSVLVPAVFGHFKDNVVSSANLCILCYSILLDHVWLLASFWKQFSGFFKQIKAIRSWIHFWAHLSS